jgi:hypothetical protein
VYSDALHPLFTVGKTKIMMLLFNSLKHVMWTAAPSYEELSILLTQTEARKNSSAVTVLFNDPSELIGTISLLHFGIQTAWAQNHYWVLSRRQT